MTIKRINSKSRLFPPVWTTKINFQYKKYWNKLGDRTIPTNYLRCLSKDTYQVCRRDNNGITSLRQNEFVCKIDTTEKQNNSLQKDKNIDKTTAQSKEVHLPTPQAERKKTTIPNNATLHIHKGFSQQNSKTTQTDKEEELHYMLHNKQRKIMETKQTKSKLAVSFAQPLKELRRLAQEEGADFSEQDGEIIEETLQKERIKNLEIAFSAAINNKPP